jgi:hypothetical protein
MSRNMPPERRTNSIVGGDAGALVFECPSIAAIAETATEPAGSIQSRRSPPAKHRLLVTLN